MPVTPSLAGSSPVNERTVDRLKVKAFATRQAMGAAAGSDVATRLKALLATKVTVRMIFAARLRRTKRSPRWPRRTASTGRA